VRSTDFYDVIGQPTNDWSVALSAWAPDYPAASAAVVPFASCVGDQGLLNWSHYCDTDLDAQMTAATSQQVTDPAGASDAWAAIERKVVGAAAVVPYGVNSNLDFVSSRVGGAQFNSQFGALIAQMWVQ
jgi:peptide/nickel transport system substrate-binding protein